MNILIVEDNEILAENISAYLEVKWINSKTLHSWESVNYELTIWAYDAVILDIWLPKINWLEVCENIRHSWKSLPVLMLTARSTLDDKLSWFNSWADDYLTKPFEYAELLMRLKALIRRNFSMKSAKIVLWASEEIELDVTNKKVILNWEEIHIRKLEVELLIYLAQNKGKVVSKEELMEKVWNEYDDFKMSRTVDVSVWNVRKKLWKDLIETVRWQGYLIN